MTRFRDCPHGGSPNPPQFSAVQNTKKPSDIVRRPARRRGGAEEAGVKARYNWAPFYVRLGGDQPLQDLTFEVISCFSLHWWMGLDLAREPSDAFCCSNLEIGRGYHPPPTLAVCLPPAPSRRQRLERVWLGWCWVSLN